MRKKLGRNLSQGFTKKSTDKTPDKAASDVKATDEAGATTGAEMFAFFDGPLGLVVGPRASGAGAVVDMVDDGGPAQTQGVQVGALITSVNGQSTEGMEKDKVTEMIRQAPPPKRIGFRLLNAAAAAAAAAEAGPSPPELLTTITLTLDGCKTGLGLGLDADHVVTDVEPGKVPTYPPGRTAPQDSVL